MPAEADIVDLRCPACGNDGREGPIHYVVNSDRSAEVVALRRGNVLELVGPVAPSTREGPGSARLECRAAGPDGPDGRICGHRFPLPEGVRGIVWRIRS